MLIQISIENYRSFRGKQTLSMVAASRLGKKQNILKPDVQGERVPDLLKVAAIYGPNASGKSNLVQALELVGKIARITPSPEPTALPVTPFRFDPALASAPSTVELHFIKNRQRYQFVLSATAERITEERLTAFPKGKEALLYARTNTHSGDDYKFGPKLEGDSSVHNTWKKLTGPQSLFISQAVANSSEEFLQLRSVLDWLRTGMLVLTGDMRQWAHFTQYIVRKYSTFAKQLPDFLQEIDVPVTQLEVKAEDDGAVLATPGEIEKLETDLERELKRKAKMTLTHRTSLGEAQFDFSEESEGTKSLIGFWLPWFYLLKDGEEARTLVVDELDSSLHPNIVAALVERHIAASSPSQLIFTTHDTHLMETKLLRRDQIWLTERDASGATRLRSIHDFTGREGEDVEKRYYEGRYRGLPLTRRN